MIHGDGYKLFSVLNSIFFLYSCIFSSDVNAAYGSLFFSGSRKLGFVLQGMKILETV